MKKSIYTILSLAMLLLLDNAVAAENAKNTAWDEIVLLMQERHYQQVDPLIKENLEVIQLQSGNGHPLAQLLLGGILAEGRYLPKDTNASFKWLKKSAENGNIDAQFVLIRRFYLHEKSGHYNPNAGMNLLRSLAESGNPGAQYELGSSYKYGEHLPQDTKLAIMWLEKATAQGNTLAAIKLANLYQESDSFVKAKKLFQMLAEKGDVEAQLQLGLLYHDGKGVPKDYAQAFYWFKKAADQGNANAMSLLSNLYRHGRGVKKDKVTALMWQLISNTDNTIHSKIILEQSSKELTKDQVDEAVRRADEWRSENAGLFKRM